MLYPGGPSIVQPRRDALRFTRNASTGTSPLITAAAAADKDFVWRGPGGPFVGKQPNISNFPAGDFSLDSRAWALITELDFIDKKLTTFNIERLLARLTALTSLKAPNNGALSINISGWILPPPLTVLYLHNDAQVVGDISVWTLPVLMTLLYLYGTSVDYGTGGMLARVTRDGSSYRLENCALTTAEVDRVLADCVASTTTGSTLNLGPDDEAPTGGATNADYLTLLGDAWTVTITP